jgi:hypothetical protein
LNLWGTVVGFSYDAKGNDHAFVRFANCGLTQFDAPEPGSQGTYPNAVNSVNLFTGTYYDANGTAHGFTAVANCK